MLTSHSNRNAEANFTQRQCTGFTPSTSVPLYWASHGPAGGERLLVLHGGPSAHHDYLLAQMPESARALTPFRVTARTQQSTWDSLGDFDLTTALRDVHCPALVVHGRQDPCPLESSAAVAVALESGFVVLDDCGHVPYVEQPAELFRAVRAFLDRTSPTPA